MSNEANVRISVQIVKRSGSTTLLDSRFTRAYRRDVAGAAGPTPGSIAVPEAGVNADFSQLTVPGLCWLENQGSFPIVWGVLDNALSRFIPVGQLDPGESAFLGQIYQFFGEYEEAATGTASVVETYHLHLRAVGGASRALVGAHEG